MNTLIHGIGVMKRYYRQKKNLFSKLKSKEMSDRD